MSDFSRTPLLVQLRSRAVAPSPARSSRARSSSASAPRSSPAARACARRAPAPRPRAAARRSRAERAPLRRTCLRRSRARPRGISIPGLAEREDLAAASESFEAQRGERRPVAAHHAGGVCPPTGENLVEQLRRLRRLRRADELPGSARADREHHLVVGTLACQRDLETGRGGSLVLAPVAHEAELALQEVEQRLVVVPAGSPGVVEPGGRDRLRLAPLAGEGERLGEEVAEDEPPAPLS